MKSRGGIDKNEKKRSVSNNKIKENNEIKTVNEVLNNDLLRDFNKSSDFINSLIHEYLIKRDYLKTIDVFQEEMNLKLKNKQFYSTKFLDINYDNSLDNFFNSGKKNEFFKLWNRLIPNHVKHREPMLEKLEFLLQIYFAVYPLLPSIVGDKKNIKENNLKEMRQRMQEFKLYLESKEVEMSKTTEYLAYYALPYVQNPREHPSYKQIFTQEWIKELKEKFKIFIVSYVPTGKYPILYDMYMTCEANTAVDKVVIKAKPLYSFLQQINQTYEQGNNVSGNANNISEIHGEYNYNNNILDDYNKIKKKEEATKITLIESQKKWTNFSLDLLSISFELISQINKCKNGEAISNEYIETTTNKLIKYESFLKKNAENLEKNSSFNKGKDNTFTQENLKENSEDKNNKRSSNNHSLIHDTSINNNNNNSNNINDKSQMNNRSIHINYDPNFLLDMGLIKSDLAKINAFGYDTTEFYDRINFILREIRLRISRRKFLKLKQPTLYSIILHDLLALRSKHVKIYINLLSNHNSILETLKLMNALTNENRGRTYMLSKPSLIDEIVKIMIKEEADSEVRQNCLGIIQKFTLRSEPQKKLIELDVIAWITNVFITEIKNLSDYTLEYGLALLMNLSLRSSGRDKCEKVSDKLLKIMINYLYSESIQVRTCINGTLYSLLKRNKIKTEARKIGIEKLLKEQLQNPNEQMKKQIQYILEELNSEEEHDERIDEEFEDENYGEEEEFYEDDYYEEDSINEDLLVFHYQNLGYYIIKSNNENEIQIQKIVDFVNSGNNKNLNRNMISNISRDEYDRPLRRPTTPMTNLSSTSNSQIFNQERKSIASKMKSNLGKAVNVRVDLQTEENENENEINIIQDSKKYNDKENQMDEEAKEVNTQTAFEKKDKLARTPPSNTFNI